MQLEVRAEKLGQSGKSDLGDPPHHFHDRFCFILEMSTGGIKKFHLLIGINA
jgi:hypothetical protein